jgi:hypothetical protein
MNCIRESRTIGKAQRSVAKMQMEAIVVIEWSGMVRSQAKVQRWKIREFSAEMINSVRQLWIFKPFGPNAWACRHCGLLPELTLSERLLLQITSAIMVFRVGGNIP